jgi:hypothetical protein
MLMGDCVGCEEMTGLKIEPVGLSKLQDNSARMQSGAFEVLKLCS